MIYHVPHSKGLESACLFRSPAFNPSRHSLEKGEGFGLQFTFLESVQPRDVH